MGICEGSCSQRKKYNFYFCLFKKIFGLTKSTKIAFTLPHNWNFGILMFSKNVLSLWIVLLLSTQQRKRLSARLWSEVCPLIHRKIQLKPIRLVSNSCKKVWPHKPENVKGIKMLTFHVHPKRNHRWATCISTLIDVYKSLSSSQHILIMVQQPTRPFSLLVQVLLENTSIMALISSPHILYYWKLTTL